jgi:uncharacterized protein (DUF1697 family)
VAGGLKLALLLRGINVGGNNKIAMSDLKALLAELGYEDIKTILNSGNAVVETTDSAAKAESRVCEAIASTLKLKIEVMARTHKELAAVVKADPLGKLATNPSHYAVAFLRKAPPKNALDSLDPEAYAPECWKLVGRELFIWYANGQAKTKLVGTFWEKQLKMAATARNWNTVVKLRDLTAH